MGEEGGKQVTEIGGNQGRSTSEPLAFQSTNDWVRIRSLTRAI
jgi:hypothetical protein